MFVTFACSFLKPLSEESEFGKSNSLIQYDCSYVEVQLSVVTVWLLQFVRVDRWHFIIMALWIIAGIADFSVLFSGTL